MKISINWLKDYVDFKKITLEDLNRELTAKSIEVDGVNDFVNLSGVVVGEIKELAKHPNADKLNVTVVDVGGDKLLSIVCGGTNLRVGMKVPVALVDTTLTDPHTGEKVTLQKVNLRGEWSEGMICAPEELGFMKEETVGRPVMVLGDKLRVGESLTKALLLADGVLDIDVLANRGDLNCHRGVAREVAVLFKKKFSEEIYLLPKSKNQTKLRIKSIDKKICPRYSALVISGLTIAPSPDWIQNRLRSLSLRPINNLVDLTNYLMHDFGQPLHAFDFDKIIGAEITIRAAKVGEKVTTLDGVERELPDTALVITDKERLIDLAGVMGGAVSAVTDSTTTIVLQAAVFASLAVRRSAASVNHRTEAVSFYEKGVDEAATMDVLAKAYHLLQEMGQDVELLQVIDENYLDTARKPIVLEAVLVSKILGVDVPQSEIKNILEQLGCVVTVKKIKNEDSFEVVAPTWRHDLNIAEDLVEEVGRVFGYDKVVATLPDVKLVNWPQDDLINISQKVLNSLVGFGFSEVVNYSFVGEKDIVKLGLNPATHIAVSNPLSAEQGLMRQELLSSLLRNAAQNLRYFPGFRLCEIGKTYFNTPNGINEKYQLSMLVVGVEESFFSLKGVLVELFKTVNVPVEFSSDKNINLSGVWGIGRISSIISGGEKIGEFREVDSEVLRKFGIKHERVFAADIDFAWLKKQGQRIKYFTELPKFPAATRDLSVVVVKTVLWQDLSAVVRQLGGSIVASVDFFDLYEGDKIEEGKKSLAFHVVYQLPERTLTSEEVDATHEKIAAGLREHFGAIVRDIGVK